MAVRPGWSGRVMLLVVGALVVLSGCTTTVDAARPADATIRGVWPGCRQVRPHPLSSDTTFDLEEGAVPAEFRPTAVVLCTTDERPQPDGSTAVVAIEQEAAVTDDFATALALPSLETRGFDENACPASGRVREWWMLLDAQRRWVVALTPVEPCGQPRPEFSDAYEALAFRDVAIYEQQTTVSAAAAKAGCEQQTTDMAWYFTAVDKPERRPPPADPFNGATIRRCRYATPTSERGQDKAQGDFRAGGALTAAQQRKVLAELARTTPATDCTTQASSFVVLSGDPDSPRIYVELDGCRRVLHYGEGWMSAAPPDLLRALH